MRRPLAAAALACAAALAVPAAGQVPGDPVRVDPPVAGKASKLTIDFRVSEDPAAGGRSPQAAVLAAAAGTKVDPRARAERCSQERATAFNCPGGSRIGSGTVNATASNGLVTQPVVADAEFFLTPPLRSGDVAGVAVVFEERSTGGRGHTLGRIVKVGGGAFGVEVRFEDLASANASAPDGFTVRVDRLQASIAASRREKVKVCCRTVRKNGKKKRVRYRKKVRRDLIRNPRTCSGSWPYQVRMRYSPADESVRDGSIACTK